MNRPEDIRKNVTRAVLAEPGLAEFVVDRGRVLSIATQEFLEG